MGTSPAVEVRGLTKRYGSRTVVDGLDFEIPAGSVAGLVGPNGAGKTTILRMLLGLVRPDGGTGTVIGRPISAPAAYLPSVGALIEGPAFYPGLSGARNLAVYATLAGISRSRIPIVLHRLGLTDRAGDAYRTYSLGMRQRLGIAAALLGDPAVVVLDEPTNGLDPSGIREMRGIISSIREGVLLRSTVLAVGVMLGWFFMAENIVANVWSDAPHWFPGLLAGAVMAGGTDTVAYWPAFAATLAYLAVAVAVSGVVFTRRDVS